ncbi:hypothetical protein [uncultured Sphingomonas sp.]|uniref:hypothetical protein n=1 Tax=uncultured Sphingomonas sp. TaxID=158754 RepID=UPI0025D24DAC|nr:hypothetical protein [uncultured Sphingomonas sp.]
MNSQFDRAAALLFPQVGRRAIDVKFFCQPDSTAENLAEQIVVCLAGQDDPSNVIANVDHA